METEDSDVDVLDSENEGLEMEIDSSSVDEEEEELEYTQLTSSAIVVDPSDLQTILGPGAIPQTPPKPKRKLPDLHPISQYAFQDEEEPQPSTSAAARADLARSKSTQSETMLDPEDRIREATSQYLRGEMSATDFAEMMEEYGHWKAQMEAEEKAGQPSLVLLNQDAQDIQHDDGDAEGVVPEVILTEEDEGVAKLRGEFFRTGEESKSFTMRRKRKMPPTIKNMMGEAHVRYARGDLSGAEQICLEIIKEQPTYKDPFHTLAMVYESQGRADKALQFFLIAGLLDPKHFEDWPRLADLSAEEGNIQQAIMCLRKASLADPLNISVFIRRGDLLLENENVKGALRCYSRALSLSENDPPTYMSITKKVAGIHFKRSELDLAYEILFKSCLKFSESVTIAEMNLLAEICISLKRYVKAVKIFMRYSRVTFDPPIPKTAFKERSLLTSALSDPITSRKCLIPTDLHPDLVQKLCIVLIHLEAFTMVRPILDNLRETEPLETFGIQLFEIAEAYLAKQQFTTCLEILTVLVNTRQYSQAEIWLRYAECLFLLNNMEEAAEAYSKVIQLAPVHKIARLNLSVILQKLGRYDVALQSLDQRDVEDIIDQDLLVEKCNILLARNRISEFFETALKLFRRHCPVIKSHDEAQALINNALSGNMLQAIQTLRLKKAELSAAAEIALIDDKPEGNAVAEWKIYTSLFKILIGMNRHDLLARLVYTVWSSTLFESDIRMKKDMNVHAAYVSVMNCDTELAPLHVRMMVQSFGVTTMVCQLLALACRKCGHTRHGRQIVRLLKKQPTDTRLMMLSAHNSFMNGNYKYALMEYFAVLKQKPEDPFTHLMIATTFLHLAAQRTFSSNKGQVMIQAVAYINKYAELRGNCQETFYNMGRFYHFVGLHHQAMTYYKRALLAEPSPDTSDADTPENSFDLKREAAFNISQIYKKAGNWQLAKRYIHRYCVI